MSSKSDTTLESALEACSAGITDYVYPEVQPDIPHGDMPGDKIEIDDTHIAKAQTIFPLLIDKFKKLAEQGRDKVVLAVAGGSGVGKSEIASVLGFYLRDAGIGAYVLSGDNYPHRIPMYNDAERLRIFRESGVRGLVAAEINPEKYAEKLHELQVDEQDANRALIADYSWLETYTGSGRLGLAGYLGTSNEIDYDELSAIVASFTDGAATIWLRRLGRTDTELWYDPISFVNTQVLIVEWSHGMSASLHGVDVAVLLNSTPAETLEHRKKRNRDGKTDSPFTSLVLEIEQENIKKEAHRADIIVAKNGEVISFETYQQIMG